MAPDRPVDAVPTLKSRQKENLMREFLQKVEVFRGLSASSLQGIAAAGTEVALPMDTYLFRQGDPADALFIIRSGSVRVLKQLPHGGPPIVVMRVAAGTVVGETGVLDGTSRAASVITNTPSVFWKLSRSAFQALAAEEPLLRTRLQEVVRGRTALIPEGDAGIRLVGHRDYVGGMWEAVGQLQYNFLVAQGLKPSHCLLDIACGALRGGVYFINYLAPGNYLGLDKEQTLIELGIEQELGATIYAQKHPEFVISDRFEFHKFSKQPQFSIAHSLFTHLTPEDIHLCLRNLRDFVAPGHLLFATFFAGDSAHNPPCSHSWAGFQYSRGEMEYFGTQTGWKATYIGDWQHPRHQMMIQYEAVQAGREPSGKR
jgi:Cyclic nucleotide-binding domain